MADNDKLLEQVVLKYQDLHAAASTAEWETVAELASECRSLLQCCFSDGGGFDDPRKAAQCVQQIMDLNDEILQMGTLAREEAAKSIGDIQRGRQAVQAYDKAGR